jgi:hypothetical protein
MKLHRKKFEQLKGDFEKLSIEIINDFGDKYSSIAEKNFFHQIYLYFNIKNYY